MATPKEKRINSLSENTDEFLKKRWEVVGGFALMGMHKREIVFAALIKAEKGYSQYRISQTLTWAKNNGHLPTLTEEEKKSIKEDDYATDEKIKNRVLKWIVAEEILGKRERKMPQGRIEWFKVLEAMGDMDESLSIVKSLLGRGGSVSGVTLIAKLNPQPTEDKIVKFAQGLVEGGMISGENLLNYRELKNILQNHNIELPDFAYRIVLEALHAARKGVANEDMSPISKYNELREQFVGEESQESLNLEKLEDFIGEIKIDKDQYRGVDGLGSYRLDYNGNRVRVPMGIDDDGHILYEDPKISRQRQDSRKRIDDDRERGRKTRGPTALEISWEIDHSLDAKH